MKDAAYNLLQHHPVGLASFGLVCMGGAAWATARFGLRRVVVPARVLLIAWLAAVLVVTLSRLPVAHGLHHTLNLMPGRLLSGDPYADHAQVRQAVANVAMFIPLGTLGPRALRLTFRSLVVSALAFSVLIETLQFALETGRATDVNDVIANLLGALLGAVVFELILRRFTAGSVDPAQRQGLGPETLRPPIDGCIRRPDLPPRGKHAASR